MAAESFFPTKRANVFVKLASENRRLFLVGRSEIDPRTLAGMLNVRRVGP
jgi:hypothetical protein